MTALSDLAFLSDSQTAALVDRAGSIVWYCPGRFDAPSAFGSLLDPDAGHWRITPSGPATVKRQYERDSLVLRTEFDTAAGAVTLTDLLAIQPGERGHELGREVPRVLVRLVEGRRGRVPIELEFAPRFEYGLTIPRFDVEGSTGRAIAGPFGLLLTGDVPLEGRGDRVTARFELGEGERATFALNAWDPNTEPQPEPPNGAALLDATLDSWTSWMEPHRSYDGIAVDLVRRSALVLQGLTDARTGAVVAAATTSLPELVGGDANWDYRFAWLRDLSFVMRALWVAACPDEAEEFLRFLSQSLGRLDNRHVPIVLGSDGRRDLGEHELTHLAGYQGSRPVRIGNQASRQRQLDVLGEVLDSAHLLRDAIGSFSEETRELLVEFAERAARDWRQPDSGMWEARDRERQYTSAKVMCWVALDRAIELGKRLGNDLPIDRWRKERDEIRRTVLADAWSDRAGAFAGALGSDDLDASVLLMPLVRFVPADDPRMAATIRQIRERLTSGPLVHRWDGDTNGFLLCSYWLSECEVLLGERDAAERRFEALNSLANDVGLLAEMAAPGSGEMIGNVPQAFSHVGLVNAAWRLSSADEPDEAGPK
ncbi:MAG TPA: glycoside hydrolase family 15 protein [Candidatus Caenarcaniphilales bacterium]|nr:glycoside hydrolase family 15 protein [Candidatus Caenarcaniphilales bacterium]